MVAKKTSQNGLEPRFSNQGFIPRKILQGFKALISRELQALLKISSIFSMFPFRQDR